MITFSATQAQEKDSIKLTLQPIVITATRIPVNALYLNRTVDIIDERYIQNSGAISTEELLQKKANVDTRQRGTFGVQSDVSVRGALFSQLLILLNGVPLNDAQTAHHNFDIPISVEQIERIEVLKGPGSALYGPDAYGGIINIITRIPDKQSLRLKLSGGENGLVNTSANYDFLVAGIHSSNTIDHRNSDGYQYDTDFNITSISTNNTLQFPNGTCSIFAGYTAKEFGALNFYGPSPSKEWTETTFLNMAAQFQFPSILIQPKLSYRRHYDKFMYDLRIPSMFVNNHTTDSYHGEIQSTLQIQEGCSLATGIAGGMDNITSTNLGNHRRSSIGFLGNLHSVVRNKFLLDMGMREDFHSDYGQQFNPTVSFGYIFSENAKIFFTTGRSFRSPSYTELYYSSRTRIGNADLRPEIGWSYEVGLNYSVSSRFRITASLFDRDQKNLIDYVKFKAADTAYSAINFATAATRGIEIEIQLVPDPYSEFSQSEGLIQNVQMSYIYLDSRIDIGSIYTTLYSFTHPRHQFGLVLSGVFPPAIGWTFGMTHKIKLSGSSYTLADAKLSRPIYGINIFLQGTNLFNQSYEEIVGVPLPGRWLWAGIDLKVL